LKLTAKAPEKWDRWKMKMPFGFFCCLFFRVFFCSPVISAVIFGEGMAVWAKAPYDLESRNLSLDSQSQVHEKQPGFLPQRNWDLLPRYAEDITLKE